MELASGEELLSQRDLFLSACDDGGVENCFVVCRRDNSHSRFEKYGEDLSNGAKSF